MQKVLRISLATAAFAACALMSFAQPALKVVVVDMAKVYDTHFKTEEANAKFNDAAQRAREELDKLNKQIQTAAEEFKVLVEDSRSTVLNEAARNKAANDAQKKREEIERMQGEGQNFSANTQRSLQQRAKNHRDLIMDEIMKVVNEVSRARGATLVLDRSGPSVFGIPVVLHADAAYDVTDEVVKEVNKDRPAGSVSASSAVTPPAAANSAATGFTVPGVTPAPKKN